MYLNETRKQIALWLKWLKFDDNLWWVFKEMLLCLKEQIVKIV